MDWKYVMSDRYIKAGTDKTEFIDIVLSAGYHFFTWNGDIWAVVSTSDTSKICFSTGIPISELR